MELFCSNFLSLNKDTALWDRAVTDTGSEMESFYVKALIPPIQISGPLAGRKFNRVLSIPGREQSFIQEEQKVVSISWNEKSKFFECIIVIIFLSIKLNMC